MAAQITLSEEEAQMIKDALGICVRDRHFIAPISLRTVDVILVKINIALGVSK